MLCGFRVHMCMGVCMCVTVCAYMCCEFWCELLRTIWLNRRKHETFVSVELLVGLEQIKPEGFTVYDNYCTDREGHGMLFVTTCCATCPHAPLKEIKGDHVRAATISWLTVKQFAGILIIDYTFKSFFKQKYSTFPASNFYIVRICCYSLSNDDSIIR